MSRKHANTTEVKRNKRKVNCRTRTSKTKVKAFVCGVKHTNKLRNELTHAGLALRDSSGLTQCKTLLLVLQYLGHRGMNTLEGMACGFLRIATRVQELQEEGHIIESIKERAIGPDGITHNGIARYIYKGRSAKVTPQFSFDFCEVKNG